MAFKQEYEKLYRENYRTVYYTALQLLGNEADAEDITQETFISAFVKYAELKEESSFPAWVKRIAINRCMDQLRKKNPVPTEDTDLELALSQETEEEFLQEEYVLNADKRKIVMKIMKNVLSAKQYETVVLFYYDELTVEEIAALLGIPEGTVLSRLSVSRAKIKKGVLEYEKKTNDKLYSLLMLPFLTRVLQAEAAEIALPNVIPEAVVKAMGPDNTTISKPAKAVGKGNIMKKPVVMLGAAAVTTAVIIGGIAIANSGDKNEGEKRGHAAKTEQEYDGSGSATSDVSGSKGLDLNESELAYVDHINEKADADYYKFLRTYVNNTDQDLELTITYEGQAVVGGQLLLVPAHGSNHIAFTGKKSKGYNSVEDFKVNAVAGAYDGRYTYDKAEDYEVTVDRGSGYSLEMVIKYVGEDSKPYDVSSEGFYFVFYDAEDHVVDIQESYASEMYHVQKGSITAAGVSCFEAYDHYEMFYKTRYKNYDSTNFEDVLNIEYVSSFKDVDNNKLLFTVTNCTKEAYDAYLSIVAYDKNDKIIATRASMQTYMIEAGDTVYVDTDMMKWQNCKSLADVDHFDYSVINTIDITPDSNRDKPDMTDKVKVTPGEMNQNSRMDSFKYTASNTGSEKAEIYVYVNFCDASGKTVTSMYQRNWVDAGQEKEYVEIFDPGVLNNVTHTEIFTRAIQYK